jgi:hypothetical protein
MKALSFNKFFTWSLSGHLIFIIALCLYIYFDLDAVIDNYPKSNVYVTVVYDNPPAEVKSIVPINPATTNSNADIKISDNHSKAQLEVNKTEDKKVIPIKTEVNPSVQKTSPEILKISKEKTKDKNQKTLDPKAILNDSTVAGIGNDGHSEYIANIINMVRPEYIPEDIDNETTMVVKITLKKDMELRSIEVKKYSNNDMYNQSILHNLRAISRFPELPKGAKFKDYKVLIFTFSPKKSDV